MTPSPPFPYEPRPRDFTARLKRTRAHSLSMTRRRRHRGWRAAALLAAIAVPALAAPQGWSGFNADAAVIGKPPAPTMPFETPGASFPGSAFYYLTDSALPATSDIHSDAESPTPAQAGPAARAFHIDNSGVDRSRALQCLTAAIYYEAASESDAGQRAVAQVVLNRVAHPAYPKTVCGVVYQGAERRSGCQFTFTCDGSLARAPNRLFWLRAEAVARAALAGYVYAPIGLATHYHTVQIHPYWADSLAYLGTIGAHRFYRFGGAAGRPATFRFAYGGGEPLVGLRAGHADTGPTLAEATVDPVAVQRAYDAEPVSAPLAPAPAYTAEVRQRGGDALYRGDGLPLSGAVRPEYENSGRWIARPGI
jgi:spore germination cell wall hydrolase CwlJ-like protein